MMMDLFDFVRGGGGGVGDNEGVLGKNVFWKNRVLVVCGGGGGGGEDCR